MPLPVMEREKKACPMAQTQTMGSSSSSQRQENMYRYPAPAPGSSATRTASTTKMTKNTGIITLLVRSMLWAPSSRVSSVPTTTMTWKGTTE